MPEPLEHARAHAAGRADVEFALGDVYALDDPDGSYDVVHAHQVLQHLVDPVAALREMLRVCRPDGVVAVRDADYAAMAWYPADPRLDRWLEVYRAVAHSNGAEPDAGRRLLSWARAAGRGRRRRDGVGVVLRDPGRPAVVGRHVGRPHPAVGDHPAGRGRRPRRSDRAGGHLPSLA